MQNYRLHLFTCGVFGEWNETVLHYAAEFWERMVKNGVIDASEEARRNADGKCRKLVDASTMNHTDARECGAEWLCLQAVEQLGLKEFLKGLGWSESKVNAALSVLIARAAPLWSSMQASPRRTTSRCSKARATTTCACPAHA